jgi:Flp pilus assembly protein TadG
VRRVSGKKRSRRARRGAAVVELAIVSPLLFAMLFGIIEFGWLFTAQHTMVNAAREGARLGVLQGSTVEEVQQRIREFLAPMRLDDKVTMEISEATIDDPFFRVRLTVPREDVSLVGNFFGFVGGTLEGTAVMRKEGL